MRRVALLVIIVALAACGAVLIPILQARSAWRRGNDAEAMAIARRWSRLPFSLLDKKEIAQRLFARDRYLDFLAYDAAMGAAHDNAEVRVYRAAAYAATNQISEAEATLKTIDPQTPKYNAVRAAVVERKAGVVSYVFDRAGHAIGIYRAHAVAATDPDFASVIEAAARLHGDLNAALRETKLDPAFHTGRARDYDEVLPWEIVDSGLSREFMQREHERAQIARSTAPCPSVNQCTRCGVCPTTWLGEAPAGLIQISAPGSVAQLPA